MFSDMEQNNTLWRVFSYGEETRQPSQPYWCVNQNRLPFINVIQYTLRGRLRYMRNGEEQFIGKGQALIFGYNDGSEYGIRSDDEPYTCFWISLRGAGLCEHWQLIKKLHGSIFTDDKGELIQLMRESVRMTRGLGEQNPIQIAARTYQFAMNLMEALERHSMHLRSPADRAITRMRNNPYSYWSIKELTDQEGCSREHFFRVFKERYKITPAVWLTERRTEHARHLLQTTALTVEDIALQCGYSGAHVLSRALRSHFGQNPTQIRSAKPCSLHH